MSRFLSASFFVLPIHLHYSIDIPLALYFFSLYALLLGHMISGIADLNPTSTARPDQAGHFFARSLRKQVAQLPRPGFRVLSGAALPTSRPPPVPENALPATRLSFPLQRAPYPAPRPFHGHQPPRVSPGPVPDRPGKGADPGHPSAGRARQARRRSGRARRRSGASF